MSKIWRKFYECECGAEGIMISKDDFDKDTLYLAIFRNSFYEIYPLSFKGKIKAIWDILIHGTVWDDTIILNKEEAMQLGMDLMDWSCNETK
jgi:hypothetical protein